MTTTTLTSIGTTTLEPLTPALAEDLAFHERVVDGGLCKFFMEVGASLAAIRDGRLYRATHLSFAAYCAERWDLKGPRAYELMGAATVARGVAEAAPDLPPPGRESHARALGDVPEPDRPDVWREAIEESGGKPTARHVTEAAAKRVLDKPRSIVNGVETDDPADVKAKRASGKIGSGVVVEITDNREESKPEDESGETDDDAWLADLPLSKVLDGPPLRQFQIDAILYRRLEDARKTFAHHASRALATAKRQQGSGAYAYQVESFLKLDHPRHWKTCPKPEDGGCGGTGVVDQIGACPRCKRRGYRCR